MQGKIKVNLNMTKNGLIIRKTFCVIFRILLKIKFMKNLIFLVTVSLSLIGCSESQTTEPSEVAQPDCLMEAVIETPFSTMEVLNITNFHTSEFGYVFTHENGVDSVKSDLIQSITVSIGRGN